MAPLTWKNVDAPSFSGVAGSLATASQLLTNATSGLSDAIDKRRQTQRMGDSSVALGQVLQLNDEAALDQSLPGILANSRNLTPEALAAIGQQRAHIIANQGARLNNDGTVINNAGGVIRNNSAQFNLDQGKDLASRQAAERANQPDANQRLADIRTLFDSGDPAQIARGRSMMAENSKLFTSAGIDANAALGLQAGNVQAASTGIDFNDKIAANQDAQQERYRSRDQKNIINDLLKTAVSGPDALNQLRNRPDLDAKTLAALSEDITKNAATYFPPPTATSALTAKTTPASDILANYESNTPRANKNAEQSGVPYIGYDNQGARRNLPVSQNLVQATSFLPQMGVEMRVFSGGQKDQASGTGSVRHNEGDAADVFFYKDGKKLDWKNPADVPIFQEIVRRGKEAGLTGFGAGDNYMQQGSMHIGFGTPGVWGEGGKGTNAAPWLKEAYDGTPQGQARGNVVANGGVANPSPLTTPTTATSLIQQIAPYNPSNNGLGGPRVPLAVNVDPALGNAAPAAPAVAETVDPTAKFEKRQIPGAGTALVDGDGKLFKDDGNGNFTQIDNRGVPIGSGAFTPATTGPVPTTTTNAPATTVPTVAPVTQAPAKSATQVLEDARVSNNSANVDVGNNRLSYYDRYVNNPTMANMSLGQVVNTLIGTKEKPGPADGITKEELLAGINKIQAERPNLTADRAGALAIDNLKTVQDPAGDGRFFGPEGSEYNPLRWGLNPLSSTPFFNNNKKIVSVDAPAAVSVDKQYTGDGNNLAPGTARQNTYQRQEESQARVQTAAANIAELQNLATALAARIQSGKATPEQVQQFRAAQAQIQMWQTELSNAQTNLTPYTPNQTR